MGPIFYAEGRILNWSQGDSDMKIGVDFVSPFALKQADNRSKEHWSTRLSLQDRLASKRFDYDM